MNLAPGITNFFFRRPMKNPANLENNQKNRLVTQKPKVVDVNINDVLMKNVN